VVILPLLLALAMLLGACSQIMQDQPKYNPDEPSDFFTDGTSSRVPPPDTVARGYNHTDVEFFTGKDASGKYVTMFPFPITRADLLRGQQRFDIYCAPCHGRLANGGGVVVSRGFTTPPTFQNDQFRNAPVGLFYDAITNGYGAMPDYSAQVAPIDRWRIIAYIRALQLSQNATINDVPADQRSKLGS
jgi:hypothetical protein